MHIKLILSVSVFILFSTSFTLSYDQSLEESLKNLKGKEKVDLLITLADSNLSRSLLKSFVFGQEALQLAKKLNDEKCEMYAYKSVAWGYYLKGNVDTAFQFLNISLKLSRKLNMTEITADILLKMGIIYRQQRDFDKAIEKCFEAIDFCINNNEKKILAWIYREIGVLYYFHLNDYEHASEYLSKAEEICNETKDKNGLGMVKINIGNMYRLSGNYEKSLKSLKTALSIYRDVDDSNNIALTYRYLAVYYMAVEDFLKALEYNKKSLKINKEQNNNQETGDLYSLIAFCYGKLNDENKMLDNNLLALKAREKLRFKIYIGSSLINIGSTYLRLKNYPMAIEYGEKGLEVAFEVGNKFFIKNSYELLYKSYSELKEFEKTFEYYRLFTNYKDSILNIKTGNKISLIETKYKLLNKESQIELLNKSSEIQRNYFIFASILLVTIIVFTFLRYRSKKRSLQTVSEKNYLITKQNTDLLNLTGELQKTIKTRDKIFSIVAHDLINPILWLRNLSELMTVNFEELKKKKMIKSLNAILETTNKLHGMAENLLNWGKNQAGYLKYNPVEIDLYVLAKRNIEQLHPYANIKKIDLSLLIEDSLTVKVDANMIDIVIRNLISNALKFTGENGRIHLSWSKRAGEVEISVSDDGIGNDRKILNDMFAVSSKDRKSRVTGLGLNLCKEFVEMHGGRIWAESEQGTGSTFKFTLPNS